MEGKEVQKANRGGLATSLIGKFIRPQPGLEQLWYHPPAGVSMRGGPFKKGNDSAEIVAAWTERQNSGDRAVKVAAVAPDGTVGDFYLTHVLLDLGAKR